jgi:general secretion pathway protein D
VSFLTEITPTAILIPIIQNFFRTAGVSLDPPKSVFFNDRLGLLVVRATLQDLDIVETAMQALNMSPPQLTIEAKFTEVSQDDQKALGFDWFLGNTLMKGGAIGMQGGTAPSFVGAPSDANPTGVFPGAGGPGTIAPSRTDGQVSGGLRNTGGAGALMTFTGILTDPQFRVVIRALEQRQGVDLLSAPKITTLSGRQAQIKIVDVRYIVIGLDTSQTGGGGGSYGGGSRY